MVVDNREVTRHAARLLIVCYHTARNWIMFTVRALLGYSIAYVPIPIMNNNLVELVLVLQLLSVCIGVNPCVDYVFIDMADGRRSSDFDSRLTHQTICDTYIDTATWYRFEHDAGNRLIESPVEPWHCGTQAPIWMNGTHPTDSSEVTVGVCSTFPDNTCGWNEAVRIRLCNESGSEYFVYLLTAPSGCPLAYCVDAASRKQCIPPEVWLPDEFKCGEATTGNPTVQMTKLTTVTTSSTEPASFGWGSWGPWSVCSKPCDYGYQMRRRTCGQLPCQGQANDNRLCNEYNCQKIPEEKARGLALVFQSSDAKEDTMLAVVLNQLEIHNILRKNINEICSQNVSLCCRWQYNGISPLHEEFVQTDDLYPAQGCLQPIANNKVYYQVIAIVNEDIDRSICKGKSERIYARQAESSPNFLSFDVMMMASVKSADNIFQATGLIVTEYIDPATMIEEDDEVSCPSLTCVLPIVLCITVVVCVTIIGGFCFAKSKLKPRTEPKPPHYEDIVSIDARLNMKELAYIVPLPTNVSHDVYETLPY